MLKANATNDVATTRDAVRVLILKHLIATPPLAIHKSSASVFCHISPEPKPRSRRLVGHCCDARHLREVVLLRVAVAVPRSVQERTLGSEHPEREGHSDDGAARPAS